MFVELVFAFVVFIWVFSSFMSWLSRSKNRQLRLTMVAFWVSGFYVSLLPASAAVLDPNAYASYVGNGDLALCGLMASYLGLLYLVSKIPLKRAWDIRASVRLLSTRVSYSRMSILFSAILLVRGVDMFIYGGGMSGLATLDYQMNKPYLFFVIQSLFAMLRTVVVIWLFWHLKPRLDKVSVLAIAETIYTFFFLGRGELFIYVILFFFVRSIKNPGFITASNLLRASVILALIIYLAFPAFLAFRDGYVNQRDQGYEGTELFLKGLEGLANNYSLFGSDGYQSRLAARVLGTDHYIRVLLDRIAFVEPMKGDAIAAQIALVIPRFLWPGKPTEHPEVAIEKHYGTTYGDPSSTAVSAGVADWGVFGGITAGVLVGLYFYFGQMMAGRLCRVSALGGAIVMLELLSLAMHYEVTMVSFWVLLRNSAMVALLIVLGLELKRRFGSLR